MKILKFTLHHIKEVDFSPVDELEAFEINNILEKISIDCVKEDGKEIFYSFIDDDKIVSRAINLMIDYSALISIEDITKGVKKDYTKFINIDSKPELLESFFKSEFTIDDALDLISEIGIQSLNEFQKSVLV